MTATSPRAGHRPRLAILLSGILLAAAACASAPEQSEAPPAQVETPPAQVEAPPEQSAAVQDESEAVPASMTDRELDRLLASLPFARQHTAALTRESALYAYHFAAGTSELTTVGQRALSAMTDAARFEPRDIRLAPGACVPAALGAARLASVQALVQKLGFADGQVRVKVGHANGAGAVAKDVAARLQEFEQRPMTPTRSLSSALGR